MNQTLTHTQIERAMIALTQAYNILNDLLPNDGKQEQFKPIASDYASDRILRIVREVFNADPMDKGRPKEVVEARHAYRYLLRKHTRRSLKSIAILTGSADHTAVKNSISQAESFIETCDKFKSFIIRCEIKI